MKYLLISMSIIAALLLGLLIAPLMTPRPEAAEGSLVINQRIYQPRELDERLRTTPYHFDGKKEQITDLIYRELLLQEAKLQKIDTEKAFRLSLRDYYEQSMIKTLLDRQYRSPGHQPNTIQIDACLPLLTKRFQVKRFSYLDRSSAHKNNNAQIDEYNLPYLELPEEIKSSLLKLNGGTLSEPLHSTNGWFRLQLTDIQPITTSEKSLPVEQEELCRSELKRQSIQNWVEQLYQKADIQRPAVLKEGNNG